MYKTHKRLWSHNKGIQRKTFLQSQETKDFGRFSLCSFLVLFKTSKHYRLPWTLFYYFIVDTESHISSKSYIYIYFDLNVFGFIYGRKKCKTIVWNKAYWIGTNWSVP